MSTQLFSALKWVIFFFVALLFFIRTAHFVDPDLGWHLKAGEMVLANNWTPPNVDPWSYTLPNHTWVDHEWAIDGIFTLAEKYHHWNWLIALFTLLALIPPFVWFVRSKNMLALTLSLLASGLLLTVIGIRPQVLSIVFFYVSYELLFASQKELSKLIYFLPIFFWVWANIHAGFPAGLLLLGLVTLSKIAEYLFNKHDKDQEFAQRKISTLLGILVASVIGTLLTPYHFALWWEILTSSMNPLNAYISEWVTPLKNMTPIGIGFLALGIALVGVTYKSHSKIALVVLSAFFLLYMKHMRMIPFFLISIMPLLLAGSTYVMSELSKRAILLKGLDLRIVTQYTLLLLLVIAVYPYIALGEDLTAPYRPPHEAITALSTITEKYEIGNTYNNYSVGGWLIHDTKRKVFTDGRSPHWNDGDGFSPFQTQIDIERYGKPYEREFERFGIHSAFISSDKNITLSALGTHPSKFFASHPTLLQLANKLLIGEAVAPLSRVLTNNGWCAVYRDAQMIILVDQTVSICSTHMRR